MSAPVPAPRNVSSDNKKPVPTPRRLVPIKQEATSMEVTSEVSSDSSTSCKQDWESNKMNESNFNTFTRRVRSLSSTSKQLAEDLGGIVQEGKKAMIESTRQSVRKITKRLGGSSSQVNSDESEKKNEPEINLDVFNTIRFKSPISTLNRPVYDNVNPGEFTRGHDSERFSKKNDLVEVSKTSDSGGHRKTASQESLNIPPPSYPPPPLRQESVYDEPQSLLSGNTGSSESSGSLRILPRNPNDYEAVFPLYPYHSDTDSCMDMTSG